MDAEIRAAAAERISNLRRWMAEAADQASREHSDARLKAAAAILREKYPRERRFITFLEQVLCETIH